MGINHIPLYEMYIETFPKRYYSIMIYILDFIFFHDDKIKYTALIWSIIYNILIFLLKLFRILLFYSSWLVKKCVIKIVESLSIP